MSEIVFHVRQEEDGGYWTRAETHAIFAQGDTWDELCRSVGEVVDQFYLGEANRPGSIRLLLLREAV